MNPLNAFDRTLASLHNATFDDAHWPVTAALIDDACGATANGLVVGEGFGDDAKVYFARFYFRGRRHPIEQAFAKLKALLRKASARTVDELGSAIASALEAFSPEECSHCFSHAGYKAV